MLSLLRNNNIILANLESSSTRGSRFWRRFQWGQSACHRSQGRSARQVQLWTQNKSSSSNSRWTQPPQSPAWALRTCLYPTPSWSRGHLVSGRRPQTPCAHKGERAEVKTSCFPQIQGGFFHPQNLLLHLGNHIINVMPLPPAPGGLCLFVLSLSPQALKPGT